MLIVRLRVQPSRVGTLFGLRASTSGIVGNNQVHELPQLLGVNLLPLELKNHGFWTAGAGKIAHEAFFEPSSWDESFDVGHDQWVTFPQNPDPSGGNNVIYWGPFMNGPTGQLGKMRDTKRTDWSVEALGRLPQPFFLAVGLTAPHNPMIYPEPLCTLYDPAVDVPPLPPGESSGWENSVDPGAYSSSSYLDPTWTGTADEARRECTAAYWRTINHIDEEVGRLIDAVDSNGLAETRSSFSSRTMAIRSANTRATASSACTTTIQKSR